MPSTGKRIPTMHCLTDVQKQMNTIFKEARRGQMETADMARYGKYLGQLAAVIRTQKEFDIEQDVEEIKKYITDLKGGRN